MRRVAIALLFTIATSLHAGSSITATNAALATASPYATQAGLAVLKNGGNAIDAAVAVAFVLSVVHPQAGNIGGGGFLVYYDAKTKGMWALDFREVAPIAAKPNMFVLADGKVSAEIRTGPRAAGVPASVAGLAAAHERFATRTWKDLLAPAIALARDGFMVDDALARALATEKSARNIDQFATTAAIFYPGGKPLTAGTKLVQSDLAATLERIAAGGAAAFYRGDIAIRAVDSIKSAKGIITDRDLRDYKPLWRSPLKIDFGEYAVFTVPPPSAGGIVLAEALNILSGFDLARSGFATARTVHLEAEAERRAAIDRNRYIGDPSTARIPYRQLLSSARADQWRSSIKPDRATPSLTLTEPPASIAESTHTTHFSIADAQGTIVSLTTTLNDDFGSGFVVGGCGFFLNDAMDDFSSGLNAIEPG
ncbi:MAG TPA: gamma-glutamyltransferase, partial [Thermoanaerobaculia bacterium]|nr:gamma-glutamyltransferase [Thermoanaerobaculia bacterium]